MTTSANRFQVKAWRKAWRIRIKGLQRMNAPQNDETCLHRLAQSARADFVVLRRIHALILAFLSLSTTLAPAQDAVPAPLHLRPLPLAQWLRDDQITVVSSKHDIGALSDVFDGNVETLLRSEQVNPQQTTVQFEGAVSIRALRVVISHHVGRWKVEAIASPPETGAQTSTRREIVPWTSAGDGEANQIVFPENVAVTELTLTIERIGGDNYVHLNEWELLAEIPPTTTSNESKN